MPTFAALIALTKYLTGRDPTPTEIERAWMKHQKFLAAKAVQEPAISGTPVAPDQSAVPLRQPRRFAEEEEIREPVLI